MDYLIYILPPNDSISPFWSIGTSIASVALALTAVVFTWLQMRKTEKHNKLMVTPHLSMTTHIDSENGYIEVNLYNNGIGPALIRDFCITLNGEKIQAEDEVERALHLLFKNLPVEKWGHESLTRDSFLPAGEKISLVKIETKKISLEDLIKKMDPQINVTIQYSSIYGTPYTFDS